MPALRVGGRLGQLKDGARFTISGRLCQLQAMGGIGDVSLSFAD